jgi:hypothetical protein
MLGVAWRACSRPHVVVVVVVVVVVCGASCAIDVVVQSSFRRG